MNAGLATSTEGVIKVASECPTLKPAVIAGPEALSPEARREIIALAGARPGRYVLELVINWLVIAAIITAGVWAANIFVTGICILLIGTRQMVLGLLLHEQVHRLGLKGRYGDLLVNLFVAYPIVFTTVEDYAKVHLMHHKYFFTEKDPDFIRKAGKDWTFPMSIWQMTKIVLRDVTGLNTIKVIRGKTATKNMQEFDRRNPTPKWVRWVAYGVVATALTLTSTWTVFLVYWVLPILTTTQLFLRWLAICEHEYNVKNANCLHVTPLIKLKWWQKALIPDLNFAMHAYHHAHPGVSFSALPKVHAIYKREKLLDESAIFDGQGAYLRFLLGRQ